ncbi:MAG: hypothetical protein PHI27_04335 [Eubacteriales bacterium]|nr:hypothetical protein [Eubacteriales bacterium]MDD3881464.1 hypothetical protein [Eubacteriales bacterium]
MRIAIIDADLIGRRNHRFPNLVSMKLAGYHRERGNDVELITDYSLLFDAGGQLLYDHIYLSKVFTDTPVPPELLRNPAVSYGGTGFFYANAPPLEDAIEHHLPDYHLYDEWCERQVASGVKRSALTYFLDYSIGFTTRGCIRGCSFCVNRDSRKANTHSPLSEFLDPSRPYICLLDDNVLACAEWRAVFDSLRATNKPFQYKQGLDERLLTDEKCEVLFSSKWRGDYIFAFDKLSDMPLIESKLKLIRRCTSVIPKFYVFTGYDHRNSDGAPGSADFWQADLCDLYTRIALLLSYRCIPYVMRFAGYTASPYAGVYVQLARWSNQPAFVKKKTFVEFCRLHKDGLATMRALELLRSDLPDVYEAFSRLRFGGTFMPLAHSPP